MGASFLKLWRLLTAPQRREGIQLLAMMIVGAVFEMLGVSLIIPVLTFMLQGVTAQGSVMAKLLPFLAISDPQTTTVVKIMLVLVFTYAVKTAFLAYLNWRQARFVFDAQLSFSQRLFEIYLRQPYVFHLSRNSAQLIRNVVNATSELSHVATIPILTLLTEGSVLAGIGILLFVVTPLGALVVSLTVGLASFAFYRITQARLVRWGEAREYHEGMRIQHLQQGLGGVKDVKVLGRERFFFEKYAVHNHGAAKVGKRQLVLQNIPRLWLELLAVMGLAALVLTMLGQGKQFASIVPIVALFGAAAFRLMPSINKILTSIQSIRYAEPILDTLSIELSLESSAESIEESDPLAFRNALEICGLSYRYPGAAGPTLKNVELVIPRGVSVGFIGGSGAGKSTLIDVVLGILPATQGQIRVDGMDIREHLRAWQAQIGYVPQHIYLLDDTLRANVAFGKLTDRNDEAVWRAIRAAQLEDFVRSLPLGLDTVVGERGARISGGQRQRIGIARALYRDPAVLVLDEATSALDSATEREVMNAVNALQGEKTILIVAHRTSTVERCDLIVRLDHGVIAEIGDAPTVLSHLASESSNVIAASIEST